MINTRMDMNDWLRKQLEEADPDPLREMVRTFAETLMRCAALHMDRLSPDRVNRRNGYRTRRWDTRSYAAHNRLGGMMWAVWPASCQAARRRLV